MRPEDHINSLAMKISDRWDNPQIGKRKFPISTPNKEYMAKLLEDPKEAKKATEGDVKRLFLKECAVESENYQLTENTKKAAIKAINHFSENGNRGIFLMGNFGSGKSALMRILSRWIKNFTNLKGQRFKIAMVQDVVSDFELHGEEGVLKYMIDNWCFDDLGAEEQAVYFGKREDVFIRILEKRYANMNRLNISTHITTNLDKEKFAERYGKRMESRMHEMFDFIALTGSDFRKNGAFRPKAIKP